MVLAGLKGIEDDFEDDSRYGRLLDKRVKAFHPNASPEDLDRIKERCRQELTLYRVRKATLEADEARRHLQGAQAQLDARRGSSETGEDNLFEAKAAQQQAV